MLERYQSQFQSAVLVLVVGMLTIVFASQFGGMQSQGCAGGVRPAVEVDGESFTDGDFYAVMRLGFSRMETDQLRAANAREFTANGIVERTLLAHEAKRLGFEVTPEQALTQLLRRGEIYNTLSVDAPGYVRVSPMPFNVRGEDGSVDRERLEILVQNLRRTVGEFGEWQAEEILAERMRDVVRSSVTVSPDEVWDQWVREQEKATIRYVRFSASYYGDRLSPTTAELDAFIASHAQQVTDEYAANRSQYQDLEEQVRARHILIKVEAGADEATKTAARARAQSLLARARAADSRGFAELARTNSQDTGSARKGGDLGWNPRGRMVAAFDEAQFGLQAGQTSAVIETEFGFHIIRVEGRRQGNVPEQEAKRDIAERLYRSEQGAAEARRAADALLARLRSGATLDAIATELNPPVAEGQPTPERDPNAPDVRTSDEFGPNDSPISGLTDGAAVARAAFALTMDNPLVAEPVVAAGDAVVFRLETIQHATREGLTAEERTRVIEGLRMTKEAEAVELYVRSLRGRAERGGKVTINPAILRYGTETEGEAQGESSDDEAG